MTQPSNFDLQYSAPNLRPTSGLAAMQIIFFIFALLVAAVLTAIPFFAKSLDHPQIIIALQVACFILSIIALTLRDSKVILALSIYAGLIDIVAGPASAIPFRYPAAAYCVAWSAWGVFMLAGSVCGYLRLERIHGN
jgi:hypothetical protein